jgi:hypothetical protein
MPALGAILINVLRWLLFTYAGKIVLSVLAYFGLSFVAHKFVIEPALDQIRAMMASGPGGDIASYAFQWAGLLNLDKAVSMLISAWVICQGIKTGKVILSKVS